MSIMWLIAFSLLVNGVFGDEVTAFEGDSVTLNTGIIKHKDDLIVWFYGPEKSVLARITGKDGMSMITEDNRYKDRLKLDHHTGSLTINGLTSNYSGVYTLKISRDQKASYKIFNVTVTADLLAPTQFSQYSSSSSSSSSSGRSGSPDLRIIIILSVCSLLIFVIIGIIIYVHIHKRGGDKAGLMKTSQAKVPLMDEERNI